MIGIYFCLGKRAHWKHLERGGRFIKKKLQRRVNESSVRFHAEWSNLTFQAREKKTLVKPVGNSVRQSGDPRSNTSCLPWRIPDGSGWVQTNILKNMFEFRSNSTGFQWRCSVIFNIPPSRSNVGVCVFTLQGLNTEASRKQAVSIATTIAWNKLCSSA